MHSNGQKAVFVEGKQAAQKSSHENQVSGGSLNLPFSFRKSVHECSPIGMSLIETPSTGPGMQAFQA